MLLPKIQDWVEAHDQLDRLSHASAFQIGLPLCFDVSPTAADPIDNGATVPRAGQLRM